MKGEWCPHEPCLFCQEEAGCEGCEVFLRRRTPCPRCLEEGRFVPLEREGDLWKCPEGHEFWPYP